MKTSSLSDKKLEIGTVFTPSKWAHFAIEQFGLFDKWIGGAKIFDPTMGSGNLLLSLIEYGVNQGYKSSELPVDNLYGIELNTLHFETFLRR